MFSFERIESFASHCHIERTLFLSEIVFDFVEYYVDEILYKLIHKIKKNLISLIEFNNINIVGIANKTEPNQDEKST